MPHKKPAIAIMIAVKPSKKDTKKKYAGDAMPNAMNKAWDVLKSRVECPNCGNKNAQLINEGELGDPGMAADAEGAGVGHLIGDMESIVCVKCGYDELQ